MDFAHIMEGYLWPRITGINKLSIYVNGYEDTPEGLKVKAVTYSEY